MGLYYSKDGRWVTQTYGFPYTSLTHKGKKDTLAAIKIQRWWRNLDRSSCSVEGNVDLYEILSNIDYSNDQIDFYLEDYDEIKYDEYDKYYNTEDSVVLTESTYSTDISTDNDTIMVNKYVDKYVANIFHKLNPLNFFKFLYKQFQSSSSLLYN